MAVEMDRKKLFFLVFMVVMVGLAAYVWYPRLFGKPTPRRPTEVGRQPPVLIEVPPRREKPAQEKLGAPPPAKPRLRCATSRESSARRPRWSSTRIEQRTSGR